VRQAYRPKVGIIPSFGDRNYIRLEENISVDNEGNITSTGVSLTNPAVCAAIFKHYCRLKEDSWNNFYSDTWYLLQAFDELA
jgi:hypothetical protein